MSDRKKFFNNPLSVRFSTDEYILREEQFAEMFPDLDPTDITNRVVFNSIFDRAFGKFEKSNVPRREDQETIEQLTNEIGRLKIEIDLKDEKIDKATNLYVEAKQSMIILQDEIGQQPAAPVIAENDILVNLSILEHALLKIEAAYLKRKTGKDFTISEILIKSYQECTITGGRNFPIKQWDRAEIKHVEEKIKPAE